jgi:hypothetical protein
MNTEWDMFAPYPTPPQYEGTVYSELVKAKHAARYAVMNAALGITSFWNETWSNTHIDRDVGLFRNTFSMEPISPTQPQPVYYVMRTLCTVLEGVTPSDFDVLLSSNPRMCELFKFAQPNGDRLVSVCLAGRSKDFSEEVMIDMTVPGEAFSAVTGVDVLNGTQQELIVSKGPGGTIVKQLLVKDYPTVLKFRRIE